MRVNVGVNLVNFCVTAATDQPAVQDIRFIIGRPRVVSRTWMCSWLGRHRGVAEICEAPLIKSA